MISAQHISEHITRALVEDVGDGDITAHLVDPHISASATIITREPGVLCEVHFATETFRQVDPACTLSWQAADGDRINADECCAASQGPREPC